MTETLKFAQYYAVRGWPVFPLKPKDKKPLKDSNGFKDATTDPAQILTWWSATENNIGIPTGTASGLLVIDIDFSHGGEESIAELEKTHGKLPKTITARTGGGGRHILFNMPDMDIRNSAGKLGNGLDIRANGGYICAAPSLHPTGARYAWINAPSKTPLADCPQWILDILQARQVLEYDQTPTEYQEQPLSGAVVTGSRNAVMTSFAGTMRRRGMGEQTILAALMAENKAKCVPPLSVVELSNIVKSVCKYEPTAAPALINRERSAIEWAFCKSIFDCPFNIDEFSTVSPDLFQDENLRKFWRDCVEGKSASDAAASANILIELEKAEGDPNKIDAYAAQLSRFDYSETIQRAAAELVKIAKTGDIEKIHQAVDSLADNKMMVPSFAKSADESLIELEASLKEGRQFIKTKLSRLDGITGGLERAKVSVIAARPSMGKTTLAWQIARNVAASGQRVLFMSLEVSAVSLWRKAAYGLAEITQAQVEDNNVPAAKMEEIYTEIIPNLRSVYDGKLYIYDTPPYSTSSLWKIAVQLAPDLIIIDHLGYVEEEAPKLVEKLGKIMKWGKRLSKRTKSHVMFLAQLNRGVEAREAKEPMLSDMRDSGNIEEDADLVIMPYRKSYYDKPTDWKPRYSETGLFIRKNRDGGMGIAGMYMDMLHQWFYHKHEIPSNWEREEMPK